MTRLGTRCRSPAPTTRRCPGSTARPVRSPPTPTPPGQDTAYVFDLAGTSPGPPTPAGAHATPRPGRPPDRPALPRAGHRRRHLRRRRAARQRRLLRHHTRRVLDLRHRRAGDQDPGRRRDNHLHSAATLARPPRSPTEPPAWGMPTRGRAGHRVDLPHGDAVGNAYDDAGQLATVADWNTGVYSYDWTDDGQVASVTFPTGSPPPRRTTLPGRPWASPPPTPRHRPARAGVLLHRRRPAGRPDHHPVGHRPAPPTPATTTRPTPRNPKPGSTRSPATAGDFTFDTADRLTTLADGRTLTSTPPGNPPP